MYEVLHVSDNAYDERFGDTCLIDFIIPRTNHTVPVLIYFHGGALEGGTRNEPFLEEIAKQYGIAVASADYRTYPNAMFPDFIRDAARAVEFVWNYGHSTRLFNAYFIGGSSAGAYLSMMLYFDPRYLGEYVLNPDQFDGFLFDGGQPTTHFNVLRERGIDTCAIRVDDAAPIYFVAAPAGKRPPVLLLTAEQDLPCRNEQNDMLRQTMLSFGYPASRVERVVVPDCGHCEYVGRLGTDGRYLATHPYVDFILKYLSKAKNGKEASH